MLAAGVCLQSDVQSCITHCNSSDTQAPGPNKACSPPWWRTSARRHTWLQCDHTKPCKNPLQTSVVMQPQSDVGSTLPAPQGPRYTKGHLDGAEGCTKTSQHSRNWAGCPPNRGSPAALAPGPQMFTQHSQHKPPQAHHPVCMQVHRLLLLLPDHITQAGETKRYCTPTAGQQVEQDAATGEQGKVVP